jgi:hypothetical protein
MPESMSGLVPKSYPQIVNSQWVIHTPIEYTAQEAVAQGKKLQNDKSHNNQDSTASERSQHRRADQRVGGLYLRHRMFIIHSFAIVYNKTLECRSEKDLSTASQETNKRARISSADGHQERAQGFVPAKSKRSPSAYGERREIDWTAHGESVAVIPQEIRNPSGLQGFFSRHR